MPWNNSKLKKIFEREKNMAITRHNISGEQLKNLSLDGISSYNGNRVELAYIRGILTGIQMADRGFSPVVPSSIKNLSGMSLCKIENKGNVCRFYFCNDDNTETFYEFSFDFDDMFVSVDELDDMWYGKVDDNHWPAGFLIPSSIVKAKSCFDEYSCKAYLFAKETKMFYLGMGYEEFYTIISSSNSAKNHLPTEFNDLEVIDFELRGNQLTLKLGALSDNPWGDDWGDHSDCPDPVYSEYIKGVVNITLPFHYSVYHCNYDYCGYSHCYSKEELLHKMAPCVVISTNEEVYSFQQAASLNDSIKIFFGDTLESIGRRLSL